MAQWPPRTARSPPGAVKADLELGNLGQREAEAGVTRAGQGTNKIIITLITRYTHTCIINHQAISGQE